MIFLFALLTLPFTLCCMEERKPIEHFPTSASNLQLPTLNRDYRDEVRAAIMHLDIETLWRLRREHAIPGHESSFFNFNYDDGQSPLEVALLTGDIGITQELVNLGAAHIPNSSTGLFPIHVAILCHLKEFVVLFVHAFPDSIVSRDRFGNTPLHVNAHFPDTMIAEFLFKTRPLPSDVNNNGQTPLALARLCGNPVLSWLLDDAQEEKFGPFISEVDALFYTNFLPAGYWRLARHTHKRSKEKTITTTEGFQSERHLTLSLDRTTKIQRTTSGCWYLKGWRLDRSRRTQ